MTIRDLKKKKKTTTTTTFRNKKTLGIMTLQDIESSPNGPNLYCTMLLIVHHKKKKKKKMAILMPRILNQ